MDINEYKKKGMENLLKSKWFTTPLMEKSPKKTPKSESESSIQSAILAHLKKKGIFHWRNNTGVVQQGVTNYSKGRYIRYGYPGSPDIICVINGLFIGFEVKTAKGRLNDNQIEFKAKVELAGGKYYTVRSIEDVDACLSLF